MNEKHTKYLHLVNDINLINKQIPKENDLKNFENWKKRQIKYNFRGIILTFFIVVFVFSIAFIVKMDLKETIILILFLLFIVYAEYNLIIKKYLNTKSWKMEYCNYGKVLDKYRIHTSYGSTRKDCYIIVQVNEKRLKFETKSEYYLLDIGDEVIVFSIEGDSKAHVTKKD